MRFLAPERLILLIAVAVLLGAYVVVQLRRRRHVVRFTNVALLESVAPKRPGWRRHLAAACLMLALATMVAGFARPMWPFRVPRERATVILAVDISLSMAADDVHPTRLEAAQRAARRFVKRFPQRFRLGLVAFSGSATIAALPGHDREEVIAAIDALSLGQQTAIGEAIFTSLEAIKNSDRTDRTTAAQRERIPARIVLLSDGSTTTGRPNLVAADAAERRQIPVSTIAFGTEDGTVTYGDQTVRVPADKDALREIADATGGSFSSAATRSELQRVYEGLGSSIGYRTEHQEVSGWFIGFGLAFAFTAAGLSLLWTSRLP